MRDRMLAAVLLKQGDYYLLQHRDDIPGIDDPNLYDVWGGESEGNETPIQCAVRELKEETGVALQESDLTELIVYRETGEKEGDVLTLFYCEVPEGVTVQCFEGQGIIRMQDLHSAPKDNWASSLVKAFEAIDSSIESKVKSKSKRVNVKQRLDKELLSRGLVESRSQAENFVKLGLVKLNGRVVLKPGYVVSESDGLEIEGEQYVSRAALKLASVAKQFHLDRPVEAKGRSLANDVTLIANNKLALWPGQEVRDDRRRVWEMQHDHIGVTSAQMPGESR